MLIDDSEILTYITGYETSLNLYRACLVPLEGEPTMMLRQLDMAPFRRAGLVRATASASRTPKTRPTSRSPPWSARRGSREARIGIDFGSHAMIVRTFQASDGASGRRFVAMARVPWELRLVKSQAEIARIARAAAIADGDHARIAAQAGPGMTTRGATALAARQFMAHGGDEQYVGRIAAGRGWDFLHSPLSPTSRCARATCCMSSWRRALPATARV